ncbi:hypothetical protein L873DRAFT_875169 [Choiromyces venosus 120613-1]|uniref:Uncharacterized protein n=1 Tax=Choiromyces venosus 120613-1 TaxID=1336337 RepID=A0A3N4JNA1_9PEZI|nr:hypothetical protein L873DRAFT_875169 [Choiromyces venosus 120613-1]
MNLRGNPPHWFQTLEPQGEEADGDGRGERGGRTHSFSQPTGYSSNADDSASESYSSIGSSIKERRVGVRAKSSGYTADANDASKAYPPDNSSGSGKTVVSSSSQVLIYTLEWGDSRGLSARYGPWSSHHLNTVLRHPREPECIDGLHCPQCCPDLYSLSSAPVNGLKPKKYPDREATNHSGHRTINQPPERGPHDTGNCHNRGTHKA